MQANELSNTDVWIGHLAMVDFRLVRVAEEAADHFTNRRPSACLFGYNWQFRGDARGIVLRRVNIDLGLAGRLQASRSSWVS